MATKKQEPTDAPQTVEARALVDLPDLGAKSGDLVVVPADEAKGMEAGGVIDTHPDAVAYAKGRSD